MRIYTTLKHLLLLSCILLFLLLNIHPLLTSSSSEPFSSSINLKILTAKYEHAKLENQSKIDELNQKLEEYRATGLEKYILQDEYDNAIIEQERLNEQIKLIEQDSLDTEKRLTNLQQQHNSVVDNTVTQFTRQASESNQLLNNQIQNLKSTISDSKRLHNQRQQDHQSFIQSLKSSVDNLL
jgi:hypothetical protein